MHFSAKETPSDPAKNNHADCDAPFSAKVNASSVERNAPNSHKCHQSGAFTLTIDPTIPQFHIGAFSPFYSAMVIRHLKNMAGGTGSTSGM